MEELEMPAPCVHCHGIFDLNDMRGSKAWYPGIVICDECYWKEQDYIFIEEEIETVKTRLINTQHLVDYLSKETERLETKLKNIANS